MLSKNEVKYIQSLCHKKQRDAEGFFVAEGLKLAEELLRSTFEVAKVYATSKWVRDHNHLKGNIIEIGEEELKRISNMQSPNEVLLLVQKKQLLHEPVTQGSFTLVLDDIQDPGNMGSIIRIADWFGISQVVAAESTADMYNPKVVQASMGSITRVDVWYKDLASWMSTVRVPIYGGLLTGQSIYKMARVKEALLVIGNEGRGISPEVLSYISCPVTVPKAGKAESLNAAIATGIILSHLLASDG